MKRRIFEYLVLLAIALGSAPAFSAMWQWSETASSNAGADPTINWAEGMAPSSINDSSRSMMARLAEWRQDISGANVLSGSSTAYTLTTQAASNGGAGLCSGSTSLTDGQMIAFRANTTNGIAPVLTVDSCSALALQSSAGVPLPAGSIIGGSPYRASYNLAQSAWVLEAFYGNSYNVPLGGMMPFTLTTVPNSNFVFPAGQCLSTTTYAAYWTALGSPASGSCPGGQFQIIDMSGSLPAGLDTMPGFSAANRLTSSSTGCGTAMTSVGARCANGSQSKTLLTTNLPPYTPAGTIAVTGTVPVAAPVAYSNTFVAGGQLIAVVNAGNISLNVTSQTFTGTAQGGASTPVSSIPPTVGVTYLLRVI